MKKKQRIFSIYFYIPAVIFLAFELFMCISITYNAIIFFCMLLTIAILFTINNGYVNLVGFIILLGNTIYGLIIGKEEYWNYSTLYIALILDVFFIILYFIDRAFFGKKTLLLKN